MEPYNCLELATIGKRFNNPFRLARLSAQYEYRRKKKPVVKYISPQHGHY
jgi:hypothetical protein